MSTKDHDKGTGEDLAVPVSGNVVVVLGPAELARVDAIARERGLSREAALAELVRAGLSAEERRGQGPPP